MAPLFATVDSDAAALIIPTPFRKTATIRPDPDPSGRRGTLLADHVFQFVGRVDDRAGLFQQILAVLGQAQMAGRAVEQPDLEMLFQLSDLAGDR